jgi:hypothetical protein
VVISQKQFLRGGNPHLGKQIREAKMVNIKISHPILRAFRSQIETVACYLMTMTLRAIYIRGKDSTGNHP